MKRILIILASIIAITILISLGIINNNYNQAIKKFSYEEYIDSIKMFEKIQFYKDSRMYIKKAISNLEVHACTFIEQKKYKEAIAIYDFLLPYNENIIESLNKAHNLLEQQEALEQEKVLAELKDKYKNVIPYEGLAEECLELTAWGKADKIELCIDYYKKRPSHQSKEYFWYKDNGDSIEIKSAYVLNTKVIRVFEHEMSKKIMSKEALSEILAAINNSN